MFIFSLVNWRGISCTFSVLISFLNGKVDNVQLSSERWLLRKLLTGSNAVLIQSLFSSGSYWTSEVLFTFSQIIEVRESIVYAQQLLCVVKRSLCEETAELQKIGFPDFNAFVFKCDSWRELTLVFFKCEIWLASFQICSSRNLLSEVLPSGVDQSFSRRDFWTAEIVFFSYFRQLIWKAKIGKFLLGSFFQWWFSNFFYRWATMQCLLNYSFAWITLRMFNDQQFCLIFRAFS